MRSLVLKLGLIALFFLFYLFILRPSRVVFSDHVLNPVFDHTKSVTVENDIQVFQNTSGVGLLVLRNGDIMYFKMPFGVNALITVCAFILIGSGKTQWFTLISIQIVGWLLALGFLLLAMYLSSSFLTITDLLMRYLIPVCTLGLVPLSLLQKKWTTQRNEETI
ncbi:MAG: hypothetical protein AAFW89_09025 [Bacteroidota bacterium]